MRLPTIEEARSWRGLMLVAAGDEPVHGRQRVVAGDVSTSFALNREFHLTLVQASGNTHLAQFAELLWLTRIGVPIFARQARSREQILLWANEHATIVEAVAGGKAALAERLTRDHIAAYPPPQP